MYLSLITFSHDAGTQLPPNINTNHQLSKKTFNQNHKNPKPPKILLKNHTERNTIFQVQIHRHSNKATRSSKFTKISKSSQIHKWDHVFVPKSTVPKSSKTNRNLQFQIKWLVYSSNLRLNSSQNQKPQIKHTRTNWSLDHHHPSFSKTLHVGGSDEKIWSQPLVHTQSAVCCWFVKKWVAAVGRHSQHRSSTTGHRRYLVWSTY